MHSPFTLQSDILSNNGKLLSLSRPAVMGILNITPDSFYAGSRTLDAYEAVKRAGDMLSAGASIIDIGACSTRPGSSPVDAEEELRRLHAPLEAIRSAFPSALLSVDTFRASVAEECLSRWNVDIINDVSGGTDPGMFETVARHDAIYVLTHSRGTSADMDSRCSYSDVVAEVISELAFRLDEARRAGVCNIIVDPGFGFAKNVEQNFRLLNCLEYFKELGCPILVGMSRKRMSGSANSVVPTVALNAVALYKGASVIRVHDVKEGVETVKVMERLWNLE